MYDEVSSVARWARWIGRSAVAVIVSGAIAWWFYLNWPQRGPWSKSPRQNLAVLRDLSRRENERRLAGDALEHADASIVPDLIAELEQGDALGRELAALALGRLGAKASASIEPLVATLDDAEPAVRVQAALAVGRICSHPQTVVAALQKVVHDDDLVVRGKAFELLSSQEAAGAQALIELVGDSDADVRRRAAIELGRIVFEVDGSREALRATRNDSDPLVRAEVMAALAKRRAIAPEELGEMIDDRNAIVCSTAFSLLQRLGPRAEPLVPSLITRLRTAFDKRDLETAQKILGTLGAIGPAARPAIDVLLEYVEDAPHPLEVSLRVALQRIGLEGEFELPELLERAEAADGEVKSLIFWGLHPRQRTDNSRAPAAPQYQIRDQDLVHLSGLNNLELLNLNEAAIGDRGLSHLAGLTRLKKLSLWRTKVTSAGLRHLANMTELRSLFLANCAITNDGLQHLRSLAQLESLSLNHTQVTDAGMHELAGLKRLKRIDLGSTLVSEAGLIQLKGLPALEHIDFSDDQFSLPALSQFEQLRKLHVAGNSLADDDLAPLERLTHLRELSMSGALITDAGLAHLSNLKELESLTLYSAKISDAGLEHLAGLVKLRALSFHEPGVTERGAAALEKSLPGLCVTCPARRQPFAEYKVVGLEAIRPSP